MRRLVLATALVLPLIAVAGAAGGQQNKLEPKFYRSLDGPNGTAHALNFGALLGHNRTAIELLLAIGFDKENATVNTTIGPLTIIYDNLILIIGINTGPVGGKKQQQQQ